ncbi:MAG: D-alanine--D-alanine ligase [Holosporaceae bacterium]|jgi:D-alanine-D-alanine ligase|nr:D-alanine--D-alanine ligase [Holosporaceae bacterium]
MNKIMKKICVLKGGDSFEREVSLVSAKECTSAIRQLGYETCEFDFTGDIMDLILHIQQEKPDCVFNSLHGGSGENGNVQAILNFLRVPYTHSGVMASSIAMHKYLSGNLFECNGIRVPKNNFERWDDFVKKPDFPCPFVIKPVDSGSSDGVHIINDPSELNDIVWEYGDMVLVSDYIPGLELTVGLLNDKPLAVTNIISSIGFYDYQNKYTAGKTFHEIPAHVPDFIQQEALQVAEKAHKLIGCRCVSRSDFRYNDVTQELFLLEVNTQPGMTPLSLLPEQAKFVGISFEKLIQCMIEQSSYDE